MLFTSNTVTNLTLYVFSIHLHLICREISKYVIFLLFTSNTVTNVTLYDFSIHLHLICSDISKYVYIMMTKKTIKVFLLALL